MDDSLCCLPDDVDTISAAIDSGLAELLTVSGGVAFALGEVGYIHTDGTVRKADANDTPEKAEAQVICIASAGVANGASGAFRYLGLVTGLSGGTAGSLAYLSATAGGITTTLPASPGSTYSKIVGRWRSSTVLWFCPSPEIAPVTL